MKRILPSSVEKYIVMRNSILRAQSKHGEEEDFSLRNGELILEHLIVSFDGKPLPLRVFSLEELIEATDGFDKSRFMKSDSLWTLYKGDYDGRSISVKKFNGDYLKKERVLEKILNEVSIASQLGKHRNILKLLGYCIHPELPVLVYEHVGNSYLSRYISGGETEHPRLPWNTRLRILSAVASAVSFMHCGTSRVIIHGDVKPNNIFLDEKFNPKLGDFVLSKLIPLGEDHVYEDIVAGSYGYMAPESAMEARFSEKSDVYGFGVVIFRVLTGRTLENLYDHDTNEIGEGFLWPMSARGLREFFLSAAVGGEINNTNRQVDECVELTRRCVAWDPDERPAMIDVARDLRRISRLDEQHSGEIS